MPKTKQQKKAQRRHRIEKQRNLLNNRGSPKFVLRVKFPEGWKPAMKFKTLDQVKAYSASMEEMRKKNTANIIEGSIVEWATGREVCHIPSHQMIDPAALPKLEDKPGPQGHV